MTNLSEAVSSVTGETESQIQNFSFARSEIFHQETEGFLTFRIRSLDLAVIVGHGLGELEIAVVIEDGIERNGGSGGGLEVCQMFEAAAGAGGKFLGAREMFSAVSEGFGFLLEEAKLLQVVGRQADKMTLASDGNLECLSNPPGGVGCKSSAVADVEAINGLHQPTNGLLE